MPVSAETTSASPSDMATATNEHANDKPNDKIASKRRLRDRSGIPID